VESGKNYIVYLGAFELPDKNGAANRVVANAKIFRDLGYETILVGVDRSRKNGGLKKSESTHYGFESWSVPYPVGIKRWLSYIVDNSVVRQLAVKEYEGVKAVIHYNHPAISQLRALLLCKRVGVRHLADITEWYDTSAGALIRRVIKKFDTALRMWGVNFFEDGLITTSPYLTEFYNKNKRRPVVELPGLYDCGGIDKQWTCPPTECLKLIYPSSPVDPSMINKGRTNLKERLDVLVDAVASVHKEGRDIRLDVYGNTKSEVLEIFPEYANELKDLNDIVFFHGKVENTIARKAVSESDFMVFFRDENRVTMAGFPGKLGEALSLGTPVITSSMICLKEFSDNEFIWQAEKGKEMLLIKRAFNMTKEEKLYLKEKCHESRVLDFSRYMEVVESFFLELKI